MSVLWLVDFSLESSVLGGQFVIVDVGEGWNGSWIGVEFI